MKVTTLSLTDAVNFREEETPVVDITDLIAKDQVATVLADGQEYEYYLIKVLVYKVLPRICGATLPSWKRGRQGRLLRQNQIFSIVV